MKQKRLLGWVHGDLYSIWFPIFSLEVIDNKLLLTSPIQRFEFRPEEIVALEEIRGFARVAIYGIRIFHKKIEYPTFLVFHRNPNKIRAFLEAEGFKVSELDRVNKNDVLDGWPSQELMKVSLVFWVVFPLVIIVILLLQFLSP